MATKKAVKKAPSAVKAEDQGSESSKNISLRGKTIVGTVTSAKMTKTVTIEWERRRYIGKYERYERRKSKVKAHNPPEINAKEGDVVRAVETRPLSKTKHFMVTEIIEENQK